MVNERKARVKRRTSHELNSIQLTYMNKVHVKYGVWPN